MEIGKLSSSPTPIFYFLVDSLTPDSPSSDRLHHYFVNTLNDSYSDAFLFLVHCLCAPITDCKLRRWHAMYSRIFGCTPFDDFARQLQTLNTDLYFLDADEQRARVRQEQMFAVAATRVPETQWLTLPPRRAQSSISGALSRVERELATQRKYRARRILSGRLTRAPPPPQQSRSIEPCKGTTSAASALEEVSASASDIEKQLSPPVPGMPSLEARQHAAAAVTRERQAWEVERKRLSDRVGSLETDLRRVQGEYNALAGARQSARNKEAEEMEEVYASREEKLHHSFEEALKARDKRLYEAAAHVRALEAENERLEEAVRTAEAETSKARTAIEQQGAIATAEAQEVYRKLHREQEVLLRQVGEQKAAAESVMKRNLELEKEAVGLRAEVLRWRAEADRYGRFTHALQGDLADLDQMQSTVAGCFRKRVEEARIGIEPQFQVDECRLKS